MKYHLIATNITLIEQLTKYTIYMNRKRFYDVNYWCLIDPVQGIIHTEQNELIKHTKSLTHSHQHYPCKRTYLLTLFWCWLQPISWWIMRRAIGLFQKSQWTMSLSLARCVESCCRRETDREKRWIQNATELADKARSTAE